MTVGVSLWAAVDGTWSALAIYLITAVLLGLVVYGSVLFVMKLSRDRLKLVHAAESGRGE